MLALIAAVTFAQTSINLRIGDNPKDSARIERERRQDSLRLRNEILRDSIIAARGKTDIHDDSVDRARRQAKKINLTPALLANAFKNDAARQLLTAAREARLKQDSSITGYDATTYERMSVGLGFKRFVRDRLLMRAERATRVIWSRGGPAYVEVLGKRAVAPMLDGIGDADIDLDEAVPLPYYPGRETLWVGSGLAKADVEDSEIIHPLARGAEAYYTYAIGDSVSFQLPGGTRINLRELVVRPRAPSWNVAVGSLWFDVADARLVRGVFRMAEPMDIWAMAEEDDDDDPPPGWVKGMISPLKAQVNAVIIEYGLHEGRFWMPRMQSLEGSAQAGPMKVPFKMEQSFKYASVNGSRPVPIPQISVADTATDSASRAARIARRRTDCKTGTSSSRTIRSWENGIQMVVKTPCDTVALAKSSELPKSIYDAGEELFSSAEADELISQALALGAQPGWTPQKPIYTYGVSMTRYNKIEALSTGIAARASLGQGYTASGSARIGIGDWQPNGELGIARSNGRNTIKLNAYRRLSSASDWTDPFSFSASLSAVLFGRDEGFYYRTAGIELAGTPDDSATTTWRLFAENHTDAEKKTNFSIAKSLGADGFEDNIDAEHGNIVGLQAERHVSYGLNPHAFRFFGSARVEGAAGSFKYGRGMIDATMSRGLFKGIDAAVTVGAGSTVGDVPLQRFWYLGGSQTVRGQTAGTQFGDGFWMGRIELGSDDVGFRPVVFYDAGWAGDRRDFKKGRPMSGAGVGASIMDGLIRFDVARGIWPEKKIRANLYVEARF
ncbi:MAG TPA: hypothetical protein VF042_17225 [Gemmatimonadaceae bacterium]